MVRLVTSVGAAGGTAAVFLPGGPVRPDRPDLEVLGGAVALVVAAALTFPRRQETRLAAGALAACAAAWAVYLLVDDLASGLPGAATAVLAASATVAVVGAVADIVAPVRLSLAGPLVVVLVAAAVAGGLLAPRLPVRASEAAAVEPPPLAAEPGERRWTWSTSNAVRGVVAAGAGVVVAVDGGEVTALDGRTGAVRWRYARPGALVRAMVSTPDLATVVAAFAPGGGRVTGSALLVVLDAITGGVLRESIVDDLESLVLTDSALVTQDNGTIRATDLRTGADRWTWSAPAGCVLPSRHPRGGAEVVLTAVRCGERAGVVALDERTGERRWRHLTDAPPGDLVTSRDGAVVLAQGLLLRTGDGTELTEVDRAAVVDAGARPLLTGEPSDEVGPEIVDPATGERTELPRVTCEDPRADTTTESVYLRVCGPDADADLVWQDFAGAGEVTRTPIGWGASTSARSTLLGGRAHAVVLPAPGAIVVARAGDTVVFGYPG